MLIRYSKDYHKYNVCILIISFDTDWMFKDLKWSMIYFRICPRIVQKYFFMIYDPRK